MDYLVHVLTVIALFSSVAVALDLLVGETGLVSLAAAAFYGLGAYTSALLTLHVGLPFLLAVPSGMVVAAGASLLISLPAARLRDDYFIIATFGFQMIVFTTLNNWVELTRGPLGLASIPAPSLFGWKVRSGAGYLLLAVGFAAFAAVIVGRLSASPFGRVLHAIREDEVFAQAQGKNTLRFKVAAVAVSAALAAGAGALHAHHASYIDPNSFTMNESILVVSMVIIGGAGSRFGPILGAALLIGLPEVLRFLGLPSAVAGNLRQVFYGGLLVGIIAVRPRGLAGSYGFGR